MVKFKQMRDTVISVKDDFLKVTKMKKYTDKFEAILQTYVYKRES